MRNGFDGDHNIATMAVSVNEIMLDEHLKKSIGSDPCNELVHLVFILLVVSNRLPLNERHYEDFFRCIFVCNREVNIGVFEDFIIFVQVAHLCSEIELGKKQVLKGLFIYGDLKNFGEKSEKPTDCEHQSNVIFDVLFDFRVPYFDGHFLSSQGS